MTAASDEALISEIALVLNDWENDSRNALMSSDFSEYHHSKERCGAILDLRRQFMTATDEEVIASARQKIVELMEKSRKMAEGVMIPRLSSGDFATIENCSVRNLLDLHVEMMNRIKEETTSLLSKDTMRESKTIQIVESKNEQDYPSSEMQLFLTIKACIFAVGEPTIVYFGLYSAESKKYVTDQYTYKMTECGMPEDINLLGNTFFVFKNLVAADFNSKLFLVCRIFRVGSLAGEKRKKNQPGYRRPYGVSVTDLTKASFQSHLETTIDLPLSSIYTANAEHDFGNLHEFIINGEKDKFQIAAKAKGIAYGGCLVSGPLPTVLETLSFFLEDKKPAALDKCPVISKRALPKIVSKKDVYHVLYLILKHGIFLQDKKKSEKNIQICLRIFDDEGNQVSDCISSGTGPEGLSSEFKSTIYYHNNTPYFNEVVSIHVKPEIYAKCHVLFTYSHVSSKNEKASNFGFSFLKLTTAKGSAIADKTITLDSYKATKELKTEADHPIVIPKYFDPSLNPKKVILRKGESFQVETQLCSMKTSKIDAITALMKYQTLDFSNLSDAVLHVSQLTSDTCDELILFIRDVFEVLFTILCSNKEESLKLFSFRAIVHTLKLLTGSKIVLFQNEVNKYIENDFQHANAYLPVLTLCSSHFEIGKMDNFSVDVAKSLVYTLKFAVKSRKLDLESGSPLIDEDTFKSSIHNLVERIRELVSKKIDKTNRDGKLLATRAFIVKNFPSAIKDLQYVFTYQELGAISADLMTAIPDTKSQAMNKLNLLRVLLLSPIAEHAESRAEMCGCLGTISQNLNTLESGDLTLAYLSVYCVSLIVKIAPTSVNLNSLFGTKCNNSFPVLVELANVVLAVQKQELGFTPYKSPSDAVQSNCANMDMTLESITCFWSLLRGYTPKDAIKWMEENRPKDLYKFVNALLQISLNSFKMNVYNELWVIMNMIELTTIYEIAVSVNSLLLRDLKELDEDKDQTGSHRLDLDMFTTLVQLLFELLNSPKLDLKSHPSSKRKFIEKSYGDMRVPIRNLIEEMWAGLGNYSVEFIDKSDFVARLIHSIVVCESGCQKDWAVKVYYSCLRREFCAVGHFSGVTRNTIDTFYHIAHTLSKKVSSVDYIGMECVHRFQEEEKKLQEAGIDFIAHLKKMDEFMSSLLSLPNSPIYEFERTDIVVKLMSYLASSNVRKDMYCKYVHFLASLHEDIGNWVEAGMSQLMHVKKLEWSNKTMASIGKQYPSECEAIRKMRVYESAMNYFEKGEAYEKLVEVQAEVIEYLQSTYDFEKQAAAFTASANYIKKVSTERFYPHYFRVCFHGDTFSEDIANKEIVFRGAKLESIMEFTSRMRKKYADAHILMSSDSPKEQLVSKYPKIISITSLVIPTLEEKFQVEGELEDAAEAEGVYTKQKMTNFYSVTPQTLSEGKEVPNTVRSFTEHNNIRMFKYEKGEQRAKEKHPDNEFEHLWVKQVFILTRECFPTIRRSVEVVQSKVVYLTPIQNAIQSIAGKTRSLQVIMDKVIEASKSDEMQRGALAPLTMALNGIIDAAVNGGTWKYFQAFLFPEFLETHNDEKNVLWNTMLKKNIRDQLVVVENGLNIFRDNVGDDLRPLYDKCQGQYGEMLSKTKPFL